MTSLLSTVRARIGRRLHTPSDAPVIGFGFESLAITQDQLSHWREHPNAVRMLRHTEETARAAQATRCAPLQAGMFAFRLPFDLPVPDGTGFAPRRSVDPSEPVWVTLMVHRVKIAPAAALLAPYENGLAALLNEIQPDLSRGFSGQTWVLASTLNIGFEDEQHELALQPGGAISIAFERCLAAINLISQASRLVVGEIDSRPLTKESLDPTITWFDVDIETGLLGDRHEMRLHSRKYNPRFAMPNAADISRRISEAVSRRLEAEAALQPHPLLLPRLMALQAEGQRWHGEASASIITLQTAAETMLAGLYRLLLVDSELPADAIESKMRDSFRTLLRTKMPEMLPGRWTGVGAIPEQYWSAVYRFRNDLVHAGREPQWWTLNAAFESFSALVGFVDERILDNWRQHPRTLVAWCEEWAGGSLALPRAAQPVARALRSESQPYWLPGDLAGREETVRDT